MDYDGDNALRTELMPDEKVLWKGQPSNYLICGNSIGAIIMGIPWTAFSVFVAYIVLVPYEMLPDGVTRAEGQSFAMLLIILPFILIGLWMVFGVPFWSRWNRSLSHYVITDKRLLIIRLFGNGNKRSVLTADYGNIVKEDVRYGRFRGLGTIFIEFTNSRSFSFTFSELQDTDEVLRIYRQAKREFDGKN